MLCDDYEAELAERNIALKEQAKKIEDLCRDYEQEIKEKD